MPSSGAHEPFPVIFTSLSVSNQLAMIFLYFSIPSPHHFELKMRLTRVQYCFAPSMPDDYLTPSFLDFLLGRSEYLPRSMFHFTGFFLPLILLLFCCVSVCVCVCWVLI